MRNDVATVVYEVIVSGALNFDIEIHIDFLIRNLSSERFGVDPVQSEMGKTVVHVIKRNVHSGRYPEEQLEMIEKALGIQSTERYENFEGFYNAIIGKYCRITVSNEIEHGHRVIKIKKFEPSKYPPKPDEEKPKEFNTTNRFRFL